MRLQPKIINILPLGDSITDGAGTHSGYRYFLHNLLIQNNIHFRFVGPKKAYDPRMPDRYQNHAGYGGNTIGPDESRNGNIFSHLHEIMQEQIDIILLMMGRNNYFQNIDLDRIDEVYYNFVHEILKYQPNVHIFIGTMNYSKAGNSPDDPALWGLNKLLPSVCIRLANEGCKVHFVDIATRSNLNEVDFKPYDNTHPNDIGQEKIAKVWFEEILPIAKDLNKITEERKEEIRVNEFTLNQSQLYLCVEDEYQLKPVFTPDNPYEFSVIWSSSDNSVVKIDSLGRLTAIGCGNCVITAKSLDGGHIAECRINVEKAEKIKKSIVFNNAFDSADIWTGDVERISDKNIVMWFIRNELQIKTKEKLSTSKNFEIKLFYEVTDNKGEFFGTYTSVKFSGLEMRIYDGATSSQILYNGEVLGSWTSYPEIELRAYTLRYDNGCISLFKGGEKLISINKIIDITPSEIELYSNEGERFCIIHEIELCNILS